MRKVLKKIIPESIIQYYRSIIERKGKEKEVKNWLARGKSSPSPHLVKEQMIAKIGVENDINIFIETGTHKGEMVRSQIKNFKEVHSIELNQKLYDFNVDQFSKNKNVKLHLGDSAIVLPQIISKLKERALFWLDGHYDFTAETSKGEKVTPIREELTEISKSKFEHIIIIDDARLFDGKNDYPTTSELESIVKSLLPDFLLVIKDDMVIIQKNNEV